jgi:GTP-binding protein LepA
MLPVVQAILTQPAGEVFHISSPAHFPDPTKVECFKEPWVKATIITPESCMGGD